MAKFSIKNLPLNRRNKMILLGGVIAFGVVGGGVATAVIAPDVQPAPVARPLLPKPIVVVAPKPSATPTPTPAPFTGSARLAVLDGLRAQIEQEKLEADLEEIRAKKREAAGRIGPAAVAGLASGSGPMSLPPMPSFPAGGLGNMLPPTSLDLPPMPQSRRGGGAPYQGDVAQASGGTAFLEAWGSAGDVQARIMTSAGERTVRVGDAIPGGRVTSISSTGLTITDARGKRKSYN